MRTIDTEHHFTTPLFMETLRTNSTVPRMVEGKGLAYWEDAIIPLAKTGAGPKLADMGAGRIAAMDAAGVDFAVLSLTAPGVEPLKNRLMSICDCTGGLPLAPGRSTVATMRPDW